MTATKNRRGKKLTPMQEFDLARSEGRLRDAREIARGIEARREAKEEGNSVQGHLIELRVLESIRGGLVQDLPDGRLRILTRDGLETLLQSGAITPPEFAAGMRYRTWVEITQADLRSQMGTRSGGSLVIDPDAEARAQQRDTDARAAILRAEAIVKHGTNGRRIMMLRQVAGLGRTVASLGGGGATRARNVAALQIALQMLADAWGLT